MMLLTPSRGALLHRIAAAPIAIGGVLDQKGATRALFVEGLIEGHDHRWRITEAGRLRFGAAIRDLPSRISPPHVVVETTPPGARPAERNPRFSISLSSDYRILIQHRDNAIVFNVGPTDGPATERQRLEDTCSEAAVDRVLRRFGLRILNRSSRAKMASVKESG